MATIYVDSNASGADNGTSFADAFGSVQDIATPAPGDIILVASNHSETITGSSNPLYPNTFTRDPNNPVYLISVDTTTELPEPGASLTRSGGLRLHAGAIFYGFTWAIGANTNLIEDLDPTIPVELHRCTFNKTGSQGLFSCVGTGAMHLYDCVIDDDGSNSLFQGQGDGQWKLERCIIGGSNTGFVFDRQSADDDAQLLELTDCDLSGHGTTQASLINCGQAMRCSGFARNCRTPSGVPFIDRTEANVGFVHHFEEVLVSDGSSTDPLIEHRVHSALGVVETDTTRARTGGASDGTTGFSWRMTLDSSAPAFQGVKGLVSLPISVYVTGGAEITLTINIAHDGVGDGTGGDLLDTEFWLAGSGPDDAGPSFPAGQLFDTRPHDGTASDLTNNSETWSGSGVGTLQHASITWTPAEDGYVTLYAHFAPVDATGVSVNIDPKPVLS